MKMSMKRLEKFILTHWEIMSIPSICEETGQPNKTIRHLYEKFHLTPLNPQQEKINYILQMQGKGLTMQQMQKRLGICKDYVETLIRKAGLQPMSYFNVTISPNAPTSAPKPKLAEAGGARLPTAREVFAGFQLGGAQHIDPYNYHQTSG